MDYFCIVGLDQHRIVSLIKDKLSREQNLEELRAMKPQLICRFPPKDKKGLKIEEGVELEIPNVITLLIFNEFDIVCISSGIQNN